MKRHYIFLILCFVTAQCLLQSCKKDEPLCYQPTSVLGSIGFQSRIIRNIDTLIDSVVIDTTIVAYRDSPIAALKLVSLDVSPSFEFIAEPLTSSVQFMLNPDRNVSRFALYYDSISGMADTVSIFYQSKPVFISNDCGFTHYFTVDSIQYSSAAIDSFHISRREITLDNTNNQRVAVFYFFVD